MAMSGRAVEAAGDVDTLLLDKTGTITLGNRQATEFVPAPGVREAELADAAQIASWRTKLPKAGPSSCWRRKNTACADVSCRPLHATFVPFSADTRMSGVDFDGRVIRKGAMDAIKKVL